MDLALDPEENKTPYRLKSSSIFLPVPIEIAPKSLKNRGKSKAIGRRESPIPVLAPMATILDKKDVGVTKRN